LGWFMAWSKAYDPRIWIVVKKNLGIDPGRGQEDLKSLTSYFCIDFIYIIHHMKMCVSVCVNFIMKSCVCVKAWFCVFVCMYFSLLWNCECVRVKTDFYVFSHFNFTLL
jgi:hypothetical protein